MIGSGDSDDADRAELADVRLCSTAQTRARVRRMLSVGADNPPTIRGVNMDTNTLLVIVLVVLLLGGGGFFYRRRA